MMPRGQVYGSYRRRNSGLCSAPLRGSRLRRDTGRERRISHEAIFHRPALRDHVRYLVRSDLGRVLHNLDLPR